MATIPSKDPENRGDLHLLRRTPVKPVAPPVVSPLSPLRTGTAKLLEWGQVAACLYGFILFALLAGATPSYGPSHMGGDTAIPGLPWFIRAAATAAGWWLLGVMKGIVRATPKPWRYNLDTLGGLATAFTVTLLYSLAAVGIVWPILLAAVVIGGLFLWAKLGR